MRGRPKKRIEVVAYFRTSTSPTFSFFRSFFFFLLSFFFLLPFFFLSTSRFPFRGEKAETKRNTLCRRMKARGTRLGRESASVEIQFPVCAGRRCFWENNCQRTRALPNQTKRFEAIYQTIPRDDSGFSGSVDCKGRPFSEKINRSFENKVLPFLTNYNLFCSALRYLSHLHFFFYFALFYI